MRGIFLAGAWLIVAWTLSSCAPTSASPALPGGGSASGAQTNATAPAAGAVQVIEMRAGEYFFQPDAVAIRPGTVSVRMTNIGERIHSFSVKDGSGKDIVTSGRTQPGGSDTIAFVITQEGRYEFYCPIASHAERGERGIFTVTAS